MQPLFTQNFLSHYLVDFKLSSVPNIRFARNTIEGLILELKSGKLESLKEEEFKSRFLNEFFGDVLGFNYGNSNFWTLSEEVKTKVDGTKVDGALGYFGKDKSNSDVRAVIEIKDANKNLDDKQKRKDSKSAVSQAFEYASKMGEQCKWIIVSNFKEIRFYSNFQGKCQVFFLEELSDENKLKELLFLFHYDRFIQKNNASSTEKLFKVSSLKLKDNEKPRHIVDKIYSSIIRFKGLQYIDPNYLASIKPFNILNEHVWHYKKGNLLTLNNDIYEFFQGVDCNEGEIFISTDLEKELNELKVIEYKMKIEESIKFLNHSQITEISCVKDYQRVIVSRSHGLGFSHKHHFRFSDKEGFTKSIDLLKFTSCDCISCNFKSLDFKHLLGKLKVAQSNEDSNTLQIAYGNYLVNTNNYKTAFNIYKKLSERLKNKEGFDVEYFLAKLNMKYLHNLIWEDKKLRDSIEIKEEIKNIDLNKILYEEIEYNISDDVREYLLKVKDEKLFLSVRNEVYDRFEKIKNLKRHYDHVYDSHMGTSHILELADEYDRLQLHLNKNRIIFNVFHDYKLLTAKIFEGFILSYQTKGMGLNRISSFYLNEFLINVYPKEFKRIFSKVDSIEVSLEDQGVLIKIISNLISSYYDKGLFANDFHKNRILEEYLVDLQFNQRYSGLISNSFTVLRKVNFSESYFNGIIETIIAFLSIEEELAWHHIEEFGKLILDKGEHFSEEQMLRIFEISIDRDKPNNNKYERLIESTSKAIFKHHPQYKIKDKRLIKKAVANINSISKWLYVSYILKVADEKCRKILIDEIEELLDEKFEFDFYDHLIRNKLYDFRKKDYFKRYVEERSNYRQEGFTNKFEDGKPIFNGHSFYNFVILLNILNIDRNSELLDLFTEISEYERWLLKPKEHDYSKFDVKWVLASNNGYILDSLKEIEDIKNAVENELKKEYNPTLAEIYYKYLN